MDHFTWLCENAEVYWPECQRAGYGGRLARSAGAPRTHVAGRRPAAGHRCSRKRLPRLRTDRDRLALQKKPSCAASPAWQSGDLDNGPVQPSGHELLLDGRAPRPGEIMRIPTLARTLRGIAADGRTTSTAATLPANSANMFNATAAGSPRPTWPLTPAPGTNRSQPIIGV